MRMMAVAVVGRKNQLQFLHRVPELDEVTCQQYLFANLDVIEDKNACTAAVIGLIVSKSDSEKRECFLGGMLPQDDMRCVRIALGLVMASALVRRLRAQVHQRTGLPALARSQPCTRRYAAKPQPLQKDLALLEADKVRNFSIIAHIDHGKSTIADRILELTGTISKTGSNKQVGASPPTQMATRLSHNDVIMARPQVLDKLQVERERGITVKAQTATSFYTHEGVEYMLNLIDTPGHVDFSYEVSCSLAACQGTILVVDAAQGVQAQTLANFFLAFEKDLTVIPVLNKIDLPGAEVERCKAQMESLFDIAPEDVILVSGKTGLNIEQILHHVIQRVPPPSADREAPLRALVFDSWYDEYRGVIALVELMDGRMRPGDRLTSAATNLSYEVQELGVMYPEQRPTDGLYAGQVGYVVCNIKDRQEVRVGDTFYQRGKPVQALPGFKPAKAMVFSGLYPVAQIDYEALSAALDRLVLNDPAVSVARDVNAALGPGWRLGFLGILHMEVFSQRLEQEYDIQVLLTSPSVCFRVHTKQGELLEVESPDKFPALADIDFCEEPMVMGTIVHPQEYTGAMLSLCEDHRGVQKIKSASSGYATFDYEEIGYKVSDIVKVQIMLNGDPVDALSIMTHGSRAFSKGKALCQRLKETIPRLVDRPNVGQWIDPHWWAGWGGGGRGTHQLEVLGSHDHNPHIALHDSQLVEIAIQASAKNKIIARETVRPFRKDVTAKCYGGDITRKKKLLSRQKEGKKRMRAINSIQLPKV
ncbi:uncharacterized protein MONBRDRAFT_9705 [Monosiga brevicollis MX1]|uniref:Translation factor GUF1 homolog, mitochondrial n=1 Tax=Monosiga brevicollis TaxID=81824 RepID=A9V3I8_MONBE|nr:uncharacterized protein MONBRDRAFT_9705 [Monosiga brevicollis MX1]EDQ87920.1 predicted protein [Monosiga brevicollis MX1]|eukprot:XP_001747453.1 hypothetical protein [Monosiga brevicollis MX1]